ncbi:hypothetical protein GGR21_002522 [Dysgonomonas hofstadii]|uniref:Nucleotidyltransferase family protein n=1 Tax=Dysgonomonas hofstadii TaxID=637886 RepID=A0A840CMJ6_9BACT|nr:nucleotidyltransferase family protein [Dysgonomonas hofstadii]MBB4036616.1 hypothetical protein [Dysgonomonas hofstadii]
MGTQGKFFALLRSGLWNSPIDTTLFSESVDWETILRMATMQTVNGILYDGINKLSSEKQPPASLMRKLYQTIVCIEQSHELLNQRLTEIIPLLQSEDIGLILLKGQGVAQNYPNPVRRQCGDIDLYVGKEDCEKATELLLSIGVEPENKTKKKSSKHENFYLKGVSIELHFLAEKLQNPIYNKRFQNWTGYHLHGNNQRKWSLNNTEILLPPVNFNALYIFNHAFHHLISGGIGLRQLCDWTLFLYTFNNQIDKEELYKDLKSFGLLHAWKIFGYIVVNYLGLNEDIFPFYSDKYKNESEKVLKKILQSGNFGFYNPGKSEHPTGFLSGKFHSFLLKQKWLIDIFPIFPKEVFTFYIHYWCNGMTNIIKGR